MVRYWRRESASLSVIATLFIASLEAIHSHAIDCTQAETRLSGKTSGCQKTSSESHGQYNKTVLNRTKRQDASRREDTRIPFWNIAHMINAIEHIEPALREGANAIEVDVSFDGRGYPKEAYHGFPCDCGRHCYYREDLAKLVQHVARLTMSAGQPASAGLYLMVFDLKLKDLNQEQKSNAGYHLAKILHENLYSIYNQSPNQGYGVPNNQLPVPPLRTVVSINHVEDAILVRSFLNYVQENRLEIMKRNVGFDVGMNDGLENITSMWNQFNEFNINIWQGDGLTNCANIVRGVDRLKEAIRMRNEGGHFSKVYYWTADIMYHIRSVLRLGADAVMTNQPQRVVQVLEEPEFRQMYRLATAYDDPFSQFWIKPSADGLKVPTLGEAKETIDNIKRTSARFIETLPDGLVAALKKGVQKIAARNDKPDQIPVAPEIN